MTANAAASAPVVVGTDGSAASAKAVLFALREAQLRGAALRAVCAYNFTPAEQTTSGWLAAPGPPDLDTQLRDLTYQRVSELVEAAQREAGGAEVKVEIRIETGRPSEVLLAAGQDAGLLVVGSRGSGAWGRLTLGSTSTEVVHHADRPVVVVPSDPRHDA